MFAILVRIGQSPSRGGKAVAMFVFVTFCHCAENVKLSWSTFGRESSLRSSCVDPLRLCQAGGRGPWAGGLLQVFLEAANWVQVRAVARHERVIPRWPLKSLGAFRVIFFCGEVKLWHQSWLFFDQVFIRFCVNQSIPSSISPLSLSRAFVLLLKTPPWEDVGAAMLHCSHDYG